MANYIYRKTLLTIIAVCLSFLALKELAVIPDAFAQSGITKVTICSPSGRNCGDDWIQLVQQYGRDPSWKPYNLIAWGLGQNDSVAVTQEFYSQAACRTAGQAIKKEGQPFPGASSGWRYICTPKGQ